MNGKRVEMAMTFSSMPDNNKNLISLTFATPTEGIPALVFGEPFQESANFLAKIRQVDEN